MIIHKTIDGLEYEVHKNGEIYSLPKPLTGALRKNSGSTKRKLLRQSIGTSGYKIINLGSKTRNVLVHRLIAKYFCNKEDGKDYVNHIDGDKTNNCSSNLEWVTRSENMIHSFDTLKQRKTTKTTLEVRLNIINEHSSGATFKYLANKYSLGYNTVRRIVNGKDYETKTKSIYRQSLGTSDTQ